MLQERFFQPKYLIGWLLSSLLFSMLITGGQGLLFTVAYALGLCFAGFFFLGLSYLFLKFQNKVPAQWEIVWWCYPPLCILVLFWAMFRAVARF